MRRNFFEKKVMTLILTVAMSMSVLSGCGGANDGAFLKTENGTVEDVGEYFIDENSTAPNSESPKAKATLKAQRPPARQESDFRFAPQASKAPQ